MAAGAPMVASVSETQQKGTSLENLKSMAQSMDPISPVWTPELEGVTGIDPPPLTLVDTRGSGDLEREVREREVGEAREREVREREAREREAREREVREAREREAREREAREREARERDDIILIRKAIEHQTNIIKNSSDIKVKQAAGNQIRILNTTLPDQGRPRPGHQGVVSELHEVDVMHGGPSHNKRVAAAAAVASATAEQARLEIQGGVGDVGKW